MQEASKLRATFEKGEDGRDYIKIDIIGDPSNVIHKVEPRHVEQFPREWEAYQKGKTEIDVGGTPLMDVPGMDKTRALAMRFKGVRNAEELAALDDAGLQAVGLGGMQLRKAAQMLLRLNALENAQKQKKVA